MSKGKWIVWLSIIMLVTLSCGLTDTINRGAQQVGEIAGDVEQLAGDVQALATTAADVIPQAAINDPRGYLINALTQQMLSEPYRAAMTQVTPDQTLTYTVEFQPPDRFHMVMPNIVEGTIIGQTLYLFQDGQWLQVPLEDDFTQAFGLLGPGAADIFDTIQNVQLDGADLLNGIPMLVFTYTTSGTFGGIETTSSDKLWLGATDGRIHQIVSEGEAAGITSTTTAVYEYDPSITVATPGQ